MHKLLLILTLPVCLLALAACSDSTRFVSVPPSLKEACAQGVLLPTDRPITQAEAESAWLKDRANLAICRERHQGLVTHIEKAQAVRAATP